MVGIGGPDAIPTVGGAMDLAIGARDVFVMMTLFDRPAARSSCQSVSTPPTGIAWSAGIPPTSRQQPHSR
jgi:3-oxoadipate CoA-transferase beta subunit